MSTPPAKTLTQLLITIFLKKHLPLNKHLHYTRTHQKTNKSKKTYTIKAIKPEHQQNRKRSRKAPTNQYRWLPIAPKTRKTTTVQYKRPVTKPNRIDENYFACLTVHEGTNMSGVSATGGPPPKRARGEDATPIHEVVRQAALKAGMANDAKQNRNQGLKDRALQKGKQQYARNNGIKRKDGSEAGKQAAEMANGLSVHFVPSGQGANNALNSNEYEIKNLNSVFKNTMAVKYPEQSTTRYTYNPTLNVFQVSFDNKSEMAAFLSGNKFLTMNYNAWDKSGFTTPVHVAHTARPGYAKHLACVEITTRQGSVCETDRVLTGMEAISAKYNNAYSTQLKQEAMTHPGWPASEVKVVHSHEVSLYGNVRGTRLWVEGTANAETYVLLDSEQKKEYISALTESIPVNLLIETHQADGSCRLIDIRNQRDLKCCKCTEKRAQHTERQCCWGLDMINARKRGMQRGEPPTKYALKNRFIIARAQNAPENAQKADTTENPKTLKADKEKTDTNQTQLTNLQETNLDMNCSPGTQYQREGGGVGRGSRERTERGADQADHLRRARSEVRTIHGGAGRTQNGLKSNRASTGKRNRAEERIRGLCEGNSSKEPRRHGHGAHRQKDGGGHEFGNSKTTVRQARPEQDGRRVETEQSQNRVVCAPSGPEGSEHDGRLVNEQNTDVLSIRLTFRKSHKIRIRLAVNQNQKVVENQRNSYSKILNDCYSQNTNLDVITPTQAIGGRHKGGCDDCGGSQTVGALTKKVPHTLIGYGQEPDAGEKIEGSYTCKTLNTKLTQNSVPHYTYPVEFKEIINFLERLQQGQAQAGPTHILSPNSRHDFFVPFNKDKHWLVLIRNHVHKLILVVDPT